jgi:hypothetical protein
MKHGSNRSNCSTKEKKEKEKKERGKEKLDFSRIIDRLD